MFKNRKLVWILLSILVVANIITWLIVYGNKDLKVIFFDVGQGDSILIEKGDYQVIIDGGPDLTVLEKLGQEMPFYDRTIELMILTHPDHDHLFGLLEVLNRYEVNNILWTGYEKDTAEFKEWERLIQKEGANIIIAESDQKIDLSEDIYLYIHFVDIDVKDSNDSSIIASLVFDEVSFLFAGDVSSKIEKQLNIDADVLKIAHHGSKTSSCLEFVETVSPDMAVISVGENSYGHPSEEVLQRLKQFGIQVLITKELGDIKLITNGQEIYGY
jgi:competence protein ComEC